ncbi:IS3 family transposase [Fundicoccus sp. Sow4_F4]
MIMRLLNGYETFEQLESDIKDYIDFYNSKRVTLSMG